MHSPHEKGVALASFRMGRHGLLVDNRQPIVADEARVSAMSCFFWACSALKARKEIYVTLMPINGYRPVEVNEQGNAPIVH